MVMNDLTIIDADYADDDSIDAVSTHINPMSELKIACMEVDAAMRRYAKAKRRVCDDVNMAQAHTDIELGGRVNGDMHLTYRVGSGKYDDKAKSHSLYNACEEMLRRNGWSQVNEPKLLPNSE